MKAIICIALFIGAACGSAVYGGYEGHRAFETLSNKRFVKILRLVGNSDNNGNYNFDSEAEDGTKMSEAGGLKLINGHLGATKAGSVSWTSPENEHFTLTYTADERGYLPVAKHLPVSPPIPEEIQKSLRLLPKLDLSHYETHAAIPDAFVRRPHHHQTHHVAHMRPVAPMMTLAPAPASAATLIQPDGPTKTHVETPEFLIDSEPSRTFFRIGHH